MGLLSGKYKPSESCHDGAGDGRIQALKSSGLASLRDKFTPRNWAIVSAVELVAREHDLSMAQVAIQWTVRRPAVGSVILGARTMAQFEDNLVALERSLPDEALRRLDAVSALPQQFPYSFFEQAQQERLHGGAAVGDKPDGYHAPVRVAASDVGATHSLVAADPR